MKAVTMYQGKLTLQQVDEPSLSPGKVLARPLGCGVCGSDLHARFHSDHLCDLLHRAGFRGFMDAAKPVVMGHEFCCEVVETLASDRLPFARGERVVALPFLQGPEGVELLGFSNRYNGAFAELMLLEGAMAFAVPDHVPTSVAALSEPLSVAVHAVAAVNPDADTAITVVGCGPVGQFIIVRLKALGLGPVLAIEPNPTRAKMAEALGADHVVSGLGDESDRWWTELGLSLGLSDSAALPEELRRKKRAVVFECVGKPGLIMQIARGAPVGAEIVVVGVCMDSDSIEPAFLLQKSLGLKFVFAYSQDEFAESFQMICRDPERLAPMVTREVGLGSVESAFDALSKGGEDLKVLVRPEL